MVIIRTSSPEDSRAGGESLFDLSASCGLQGPGPRGRTGPPARSRRPHDRAPGEQIRQGESWQKTLRCTDHSMHRCFCTPPPCAQMFTSCQNPHPSFLCSGTRPFVATRLLIGRSVLGRLGAASRLAGAEHSIWLRRSQPEVLSFLVGQGARPCPSGRSLDLR